MIEIVIHDAANETPAALRKLSDYLLALAGVAAPLPRPAPSIADATPLRIAPEAPKDGPAAPMPDASPPVPTDLVLDALLENVPTAAPVGGVDLDTSGLPHDTRIHSSPPSKKQDGTWRARRNLADGETERVEAELRALMSIPQALDLAAMFGVQPAGEPVEIVTTVAPIPVMPPPAPPAPIPAPPATGATPGAVFGQLMKFITSNSASGKLATGQVRAALAAVKLEPGQLPTLAARPDLAQAVIDKLTAMIGDA
jgi:hypothetical protein